MTATVTNVRTHTKNETTMRTKNETTTTNDEMRGAGACR
jgi:hypothetical protein